MVPHGGQPPTHIALQVISFGDGGHNWLSDHGSVNTRGGEGRKKKGKNKQTNTNKLSTLVSLDVTDACFLFAFTDWLGGTVMSTGENSEVCQSPRDDLMTPLAPPEHLCVAPAPGAVSLLQPRRLPYHYTPAQLPRGLVFMLPPVTPTYWATMMMQILQVCISHMRKLQLEKAPTLLSFFFFFFNSSGVCCSTDLKRFPELSILLKRGLTNPKEVNWEQTLSWWWL